MWKAGPEPSLVCRRGRRYNGQAVWRCRTWTILSALVVLCATSASARQWVEEDFGQLPVAVYTFRLPDESSPGAARTVIGELSSHAPTTGDTFYDVGRYYGLGHNEMVAANRDVDEWIPAQGEKDIVLPTQWILPCCRYEGLVINIPEMRLYYYPPHKKGQPRTVITHPVGLGRTQWRTPQGAFKITEKTKDPTWVIPESIRQERIEEKGYSEKMIKGGTPENPLGRYRMRLSLPLYAIHGTNIPWGVGMSVSHGCIRMYPEDIDRLYPRTPVGTPGEFVYETVKIGEMNGRVYVEVHDDIYGQQPGRWRHAIGELQKKGLLDLVDEEKLHKAITEMRGIPVDVSRDDLHLIDPRPGVFRPQAANEIDGDDPYPHPQQLSGG